MSNVYTQLISDTFHRANQQPLTPANWTVVSGFPLLQLAVVSNVCVCGTGTPQGQEYYTGTALPDNQYVEATIGAFVANAVTSSVVTIVSRSALDGSDGYFLILGGNGDGTATLDLLGSGFEQTVTIPVVNSGDKIRVEALGTSISAFYNGVLKITVVDAAATTGPPGLEIFQSAVQTDTTVTLFTAGSITVSTPSSFSPSDSSIEKLAGPLYQLNQL